MKQAVVMDTNVAIVANGGTSQARERCRMACIIRMEKIRNEELLLLDGKGMVIEEYRRYLSHSGQPGPGDAFFLWLWNNQANQDYCRIVNITQIEDNRCFDEFPDDPELHTFDRDDRKFVAIAVANGHDSIILNASDTDWWIHRAALARHTIAIEFICPELMEEK
jgi:hypothetical protein